VDGHGEAKLKAKQVKTDPGGEAGARGVGYGVTVEQSDRGHWLAFDLGQQHHALRRTRRGERGQAPDLRTVGAVAQ
jgi:hypothetical protein